MSKIIDDLRPDNQVPLITGGSKGIGLGIASCFVEAGAKVLICARREKELEAAATQLGDAADYIAFDVSGNKDFRIPIKHAIDKFGSLSILVNNAGHNISKATEQLTEKEFNLIVKTQFYGAFKLCREAIPYLRKTNFGSRLFTVSKAALAGQLRMIAYAASKYAYLGMIKSFGN